MDSALKMDATASGGSDSGISADLIDLGTVVEMTTGADGEGNEDKRKEYS